jgi:hypothetical protein
MVPKSRVKMKKKKKKKEGKACLQWKLGAVMEK